MLKGLDNAIKHCSLFRAESPYSAQVIGGTILSRRDKIQVEKIFSYQCSVPYGTGYLFMNFFYLYFVPGGTQ